MSCIISNSRFQRIHNKRLKLNMERRDIMGRFHNMCYDRGLYRSRSGIIMGVCRGVGDFLNLSVFWIRAILVILFLLSGFWPIVVLYFVAALLMKSEPIVRYHRHDEEESWGAYSRTKRPSSDHIKRYQQTLERRLRNLENTVTSKEYDWEQRLRA
jgi:phage shock protein C